MYARDWVSGDTAPVKVLQGAATFVIFPSAIAFDSSGQMYVASGELGTVAQFARDWPSGNTAPLRVLAGPATQLDAPVSLGFDPAGRMLVLNQGAPSITTYAADWSSAPGGSTVSVAPEETLAGPVTGLDQPRDLIVRSHGSLLVSSSNDDAIVRYVAPVSVSITAQRAKPTKGVLVGRTSGVVPGTTITAFVWRQGSGAEFVARRPITLQFGDMTEGRFRYRITGLARGKAYEAFVVVEEVRSATVIIPR